MPSGSRDFPKSNIITTVFLDRDGVINEKMPEGRYVSTPGELRLIPGVSEAILRLNVNGIRVLVISNQRGVALGIMTLEALEDVQRFLQEQLNARGARIDRFYYCPHDKNSCDCRKPLPGLFYRAVNDFPDIKPETSVMIGDSISDIGFAHGLGIHSIWIRGAIESRKAGWEGAASLADDSSNSLADAVELLLSRSDPSDQKSARD